MKKIIAKIVVPTSLLALIIVGIFGVFSHVFSPLPVFGNTAITTILGTDTLSASRTTINNNFSSLNTNKVEISDLAGTTTLSQLTTLLGLISIGTITTGTWNAGTIGAQYGGTGSTTLSSNQLLLGNGTNAIKTVVGWGTSGQSLVSNGTTLAPSFQSVGLDTTQNYNWTGTNLFKNLNASSTVANPIVLNGLSYNTPSVRGVAGSSFIEDGSGNLSLSYVDWQLVVSTTTTIAQKVLGATTTNQYGHLKIIIDSAGLSSADQLAMQFNNDGGISYENKNFTDYANPQTNTTGNFFVQIEGAATTSPLVVNIDMTQASTTQRKFLTFVGSGNSSGTLSPLNLTGAGVWNNTTTRAVNFTLFPFNGGATTLKSGTTMTIYGTKN